MDLVLSSEVRVCPATGSERSPPRPTHHLPGQKAATSNRRAN